VIAQRCLGSFWKEREGALEPIVASSERRPIPDVAIVRAPEGFIVARCTIVDAMNALWAARS
jgi:hypothetical protein